HRFEEFHIRGRPRSKVPGQRRVTVEGRALRRPDVPVPVLVAVEAPPRPSLLLLEPGVHRLDQLGGADAGLPLEADEVERIGQRPRWGHASRHGPVHLLGRSPCAPCYVVWGISLSYLGQLTKILRPCSYERNEE